MPSTQLAKSRMASIELRMPTRGTPDMLMVACGGGTTMLDKVGNPIAEMQLRGLGGSKVDAQSEKTSSLRDYMADFDSAIKAGKMKAPALLGYSHGGYFAAAYAALKPEAVSALILIEPALYTDRAELEHRAELAVKGDSEGSVHSMLNYIERSSQFADAEFSKTAGSISKSIQSGATLAQEFLVRARNPISSHELARLTMPVLLIGGTESRVSDMVVKAAQSIPHANVAWLRGASHLDLLWNGDAKIGARVSSVINGFMGSL